MSKLQQPQSNAQIPHSEDASHTHDVSHSNNGDLSSDYGPVSLELCDQQLRSKVVQSISNARSGEVAPDRCINLERLAEISAYINRLEDYILRHHNGEMDFAEVLEQLKNCAGLDIKAISYTLDIMHAEDA